MYRARLDSRRDGSTVECYDDGPYDDIDDACNAAYALIEQYRQECDDDEDMSDIFVVIECDKKGYWDYVDTIDD